MDLVRDIAWLTFFQATICSTLTIQIAYTVFNVYLPKLLENRSGLHTGPPKTLEETMWDVVIFTLGGCPGAFVR